MSLHSVRVLVTLLLGVSVASAQPIFDLSYDYSIGGGAAQLTSSDFDGDGVLDLALAVGNIERMVVMFGNGDGTFQEAVSYSVPDQPKSIANADLDGDGDQDLVIASNTPGLVSIMINEGEGTFHISRVLTIERPTGVVCLDVDGDGDQDVAACSWTDHSVVVWKNSGNAAFPTMASYAVDQYPDFIIASDLDGDGTLDLATANHIGRTVSVLKNDGFGSFQPAMHLVTSCCLRSVHACDVNGDGFNDLAACGAEGVSVLINDASGSFESYVNYSTGSPNGVSSIDFDRDGDVDLVAANWDANLINTLSILKNTGDGQFSVVSTLNVGAGPWAVISADFNNDGGEDLAVTRLMARSVSILLNSNLMGNCSLVPLTGDVDQSGAVTAGDIVYMVNFVFKSGPAPAECEAVADVNCSGSISSADVIYTVNYAFKSGPDPCDVCALIPGVWTCP